MSIYIFTTTDIVYQPNVITLLFCNMASKKNIKHLTIFISSNDLHSLEVTFMQAKKGMWMLYENN